MDINQNLGNLMKEAQKMQQRMQEAQEQLTQLIVKGKSGGGMIEIDMNGRHDVTKVKINDAVGQVEKVSKEKITQLTAGLNIPTDFMKDGKE